MQPFALGPSEGKVVQNGVVQRESRVEGTGERRKGEAVGASVRDTWTLQQPSFLRRASPSQGKSNYLILWHIAYAIPPWNPACFNLHLFFPFIWFVLFVCVCVCFIFCYSFFSPILHLFYHCSTSVYIFHFQINLCPPTSLIHSIHDQINLSNRLMRRQQHTQTQGMPETGCKAQQYHTLSWETDRLFPLMGEP